MSFPMSACICDYGEKDTPNHDDKKLLAPTCRVWRRNWGAGFGKESGRFGFFVLCDGVLWICYDFVYFVLLL